MARVVEVLLSHGDVAAVSTVVGSQRCDLVRLVFIWHHLDGALMSISQCHLPACDAQELDIVSGLPRDAHCCWCAKELERCTDTLVIDSKVFVYAEGRSAQIGRL